MTRRFLAALSVLAFVLAWPVRLDAHAHLEKSSPANGASLAASPGTVELWFSEAPQLAVTRVAIVGADSVEHPLLNLRLDPAAKNAVIGDVGGRLAPGRYAVRWRTAAADGHPSSGAFWFAIAAPAAPAAPAAGAMHADTTHAAVQPQAGASSRAATETGTAGSPSVASVVSRWLEFIALLGFLGAVVFRVAVLPRARREGVATEGLEALALGTARITLAAFIVFLLCRLVLEASALHVAFPVVLRTSWGLGWHVGLAGAVVAVLGIILLGARPPGWVLAAIGAVLLAVYPSLTGHAAASANRALAVGLDIVHVAAAASWVGTLLLVAIAVARMLRDASPSRDAHAAALVRAYHPVALASVALVLFTGVGSLYQRLGAISGLWTTGYGQVLLVKIAVVLVVLVLGGHNWRVATPRLGTEQGTRGIARSMRAELLVACVVLAVTALLVATPSPELPATTPSASSASGSP